LFYTHHKPFCLGGKLSKRGKNWTEAETITFIELWSEYYDKLMSGGSRNTPIYNLMAEKLKEVLPNRLLSGADVRAKIGNLVTEYRRKRKEQGKTGASPCAWPYFDLMDKMLGEYYHLHYIF